MQDDTADFISSHMSDGLCTIRVSAERLDASIILDFKEQVRSIVKQHDARVMLDMGPVAFLDSSGLGALVAIMKMLDGRKLELAHCQPAVLKVLRLTKMDSVFVLHDAPTASQQPDQAAKDGGQDAA